MTVCILEIQWVGAQAVHVVLVMIFSEQRSPDYSHSTYLAIVCSTAQNCISHDQFRLGRIQFALLAEHPHRSSPSTAKSPQSTVYYTAVHMPSDLVTPQLTSVVFLGTDCYF